ncbi:TPM domain-containing protein [Haoranjiania flava]|uniref:TPM domain-containing protein n=1 Tax=Haoranjiania flava TaxID=1856322 RepID=A0AAE3LKQ4_9BACT|nr:TPM domain-containing protein [Haoranjiania flava]MCU7695172.1 TPM domain-containing protein [Haoranjiania flava]
MIKFFRTKSKNAFFTEEEQKQIISAIQQAEMHTSGEVRLFVESKCQYVNALDKAVAIFEHLQMHQTANRNGVLIYIALKHKQLAIFGDEGIHQRVGKEFWDKELQKIISEFKSDQFVAGIVNVINDIGAVLKTHFPAPAENNKNELPDDIIFGS